MSAPSVDPSVEQQAETSPTGRYIRYNSILGRGSYKTVYKAFDTEEALEVAWNKLHVERLSPHDMEKVTNEASLLRQVEHKNIIHFYDTWPGVDGNGNHTINFITEQMMSGTLKEYLKKAKAIKLKVIRRWCANILEAIAYLHSQDPPIMHRDLKCDNIFINGHVGEVKIGDLGLSGVKEREKADSVIGTPEFMAPELYEESYTEKVDIYAFGMCLLEIVSMEYPYSECNNMAQIFKKVFNGEKPRAFNMLIDGAVKDVIAACLEREERRPSAVMLLQHPLFSEWEKDDGHASNLSLVKGHQTETETKLEAVHSDSSSMPIGTELIDWSDPLKRNVLVSMIEGEGGGNEEQQVSVIASRENGGFYIGLEIPIRDAIKRVEFTFDPFQDNSKHIAQEMVSEFGLGAEQEDVIRAEIDRRVQIAKSQREAASRNATPQGPPRPSSSGESASTETASVATPTAIPVPSVSPIVNASAIASEPMKHVPGAISPRQRQPLPTMQQPKLPNGSTPGLNNASVNAEVAAQSRQEPNHESHMGMHRQPVSNPSDFDIPKVPVLPMESLAVHDGISSSSFISSHPQSIASTDTAPVILPTGTRQETHEVKPLNVQSSLPTVVKSGVGMTPHGPQALQMRDIIHNRVPVETPQVQEIKAPMDKETTIDGQVSYELNVTGKNVSMNRAVAPSPRPQESIESSVQNDGDETHHSSVSTFNIPQQVQARQGMHSSHTANMPPEKRAQSVSTPQDSLHSREGGLVDEQLPQPSNAEGQPTRTLTQPAEIERALLRDPSNVTTLPARIEGTFGQDSSNIRHFPQSLSDTQLPASSSTTVGIPTRPPSTPIPPAASGLDLPSEQQLATQQTAPATTTPLYEKMSPDSRHEDAGATSPHNTSELDSAAQSRHLSPPQEQGKYSSQTATREFPVNDGQPKMANISRSGSGSIPQIVVVESSKGASTERSRRGQNDPTSSPRPSYGRVQLPTSVVYFGSQSGGAGRGPTEQSDPPHGIHQQIGPGVDVVRKEVSRPQQRSFPEKALMVDSWKNIQADNSGSKTRGPPGTGTGREADAEYYTMCLKLMDSCARGNFDDVFRKIETGANPQFADYDMRTPLHIAAAEGHKHICALLLERGALVSAKDRWANSPLADAIDNHHIEVQQLLQAHGAVYEKRNSDEMLHYELMRGCAAGDLEVVRAQIVAGADVTRCDYDRRTPLHIVCSKGHVEVTELLLVNGASSEVRDRKGRSPVDDAVNNGHRNVLRVLRQYGAVIPRHLFEAQPELEYQRGIDLVEHAARGRLDAVKQALSQGVDPNFRDYDNRTALHLACVEGRLEVVQFLLQAGASISARDRWGSMPADEAKKAGFGNILEELTLWESHRKQRQASVTSYDQSARAMNGHNRSSLPISDERSPHFDQLSHGIASSVSMGAIPSINLSADDFAAKHPMPSRSSGAVDRVSSTSLPIHIERDEDSVVMSFDDEQRMLEQEFNTRRQELAEKYGRPMEGLSRRRSIDSTRSSRGSGEPIIAIIGQPRQVPRDAGLSLDMEKRVDESKTIPSTSSYSSMSGGNEGPAVSSPRHSSSGLQAPLVVSDGISSRVSTVQVLSRGGGVVVEEIRRENPEIRLLVDNLVDVASRKR